MAVIIGILLVILIIWRIKRLIEMFLSKYFWIGLVVQTLYFFSALFIISTVREIYGSEAPFFYFMFCFAIITWIFFLFMFRSFRTPILFCFGVVTLGLLAVGVSGGDGDGGDFSDIDLDLDGPDFPDFDDSFITFDPLVGSDLSVDSLALESQPLPTIDSMDTLFTDTSSVNFVPQTFAFQASTDVGQDFDWLLAERQISASGMELISADLDNNHVLDAFDLDKDHDGIVDSIDSDLNNNGTLDYLEVDIDGDGIHDSVDTDLDGDFIPDAYQTDLNHDGIPDLIRRA